MSVLKNKPHIHLRYVDPETKGDYLLAIMVKIDNRVLISGPTIDENQDVQIVLSAERLGVTPSTLELFVEYPKPLMGGVEFEVKVWGQNENPGDNLLGKAKVKYEEAEDPDIYVPTN